MGEMTFRFRGKKCRNRIFFLPLGRAIVKNWVILI